jgi:hypothetical protein
MAPANAHAARVWPACPLNDDRCPAQTLEVEVEHAAARVAGLAATVERETQARVVAEADLAMAKRHLIRMPSKCAFAAREMRQ